MPDTRATLLAACRLIIDESQRISIDNFEDALAAISDDLTCGERDDDRYMESVLDGIRWGVRAAVCVELGGSTILRIITPDGARITHEWHNAPRSTVGRASIMQSVQSAMGDHNPGQEVTAVWNEAAAQTVDAIEAEARKVATDYSRYNSETADNLRMFADHIREKFGKVEADD